MSEDSTTAASVFALIAEMMIAIREIRAKYPEDQPIAIKMSREPTG